MYPLSLTLLFAASVLPAACNALESASAKAIRSAPKPGGTSDSHWHVGQFKNLIVFGDSYSDEDGLSYFTSHNATPPPPGTLLPPGNASTTSDGGTMWDRFVVQYTNQSLTLHNYAISGAVCSNNLTRRIIDPAVAPDVAYPDVAGYEIPLFLRDKQFDKNVATGAPFFSPPLSGKSAVYALWIGVNDVGVYFTRTQTNGSTVVDYLDCVYTQLDTLYASGGRHFVLFNVPPLELVPLYANLTEGGVGANLYDQTRPANYNHTASAIDMHELVAGVDDVYRYRTPYETLVNGRYPGAHFALFDVNKLFTDIHTYPAHFLNGTAPLNVTGYIHHCSVSGANCTTLPSPDSFEWYDPLHPSQQVQRQVAKTFVDILGGNSSYATYYDAT